MTMGMRQVLSGMVIVASLVGCNTPVPIFPIPIFPMAPETSILPEQEQKQALVEVALKKGERKRTIRSSPMALRGGRTIAVAPILTGEHLLKGLPSPEMRVDLLNFYVSPPVLFSPPKSGDGHYFNFTVTPEFAEANLPPFNFP